MKRVQQGFTLIELMIVVAIVGILAAIALPAYQDYTVRAKVSEGLARMAEAKTSVAEYFSANGTFPPSVTSAGFNTAQAGYVASLNCGVGACNRILVQFNNKEPNLNNMQVGLSGLAQNGQIVWKCTTAATVVTGTPVTNKYLPASCRT